MFIHTDPSNLNNLNSFTNAIYISGYIEGIGTGSAIIGLILILFNKIFK